jgi:hypothetical protein
VVARQVRTNWQTSRKEPTLSFFDDGDEPRTAIRSPQPRPRRPPARTPRRRGADDRTLLLRRGGAAVIVLVVLIGLVLGIKAILNHQAIQGLKNYDANVNGIVSQEQAGVRDPFFHQLDGAFESADPAEVPTNLQQILSSEAGYYHEAEGWSVPAQMVGAQRYFVETLGLRYEALEGIEAEMKNALGVSNDQGTAIKLIAGQMEKLLASDVLYADRVAPLITQALTTAGIVGETTETSAFLPDIGWLTPVTVADRILGHVPSSLGGTSVSGTPGHALISVSVESASGTTTALSSTTANTFAYTPAGVTFVLDVENSGNVTEYGVGTQIYFYKKGLDTSCLTTPSQLAETVPGHYYNSAIVFAPTRCANLSDFFNVPLEMTAKVNRVPGEKYLTNNVMSFLVEFTH